VACETICTFFYVFLRFFQNPKKHDFLRFFELLHTFSRTVPVVGRWLTPWKYASPQVLSCDIKRCKRNERYPSEKFDHRVLGPDLQ